MVTKRILQEEYSILLVLATPKAGPIITLIRRFIFKEQKPFGGINNATKHMLGCVK